MLEWGNIALCCAEFPEKSLSRQAIRIRKNKWNYLKAGTGNDCAGHNNAMLPFTPTLERF